MEQAASARLRDARNLTAGSGSTPAVDGRGTRGGAPSPPRMSGDAPGMAAKADIDNLGARVLKTAVSIVPAQAVFPISGAVRPRQTAPPDWKVSLGGDFSRIFFRPCDKGRSGDLCHGGSPGSLRRRSLGATTAMTRSTGFLRTLFAQRPFFGAPTAGGSSPRRSRSGQIIFLHARRRGFARRAGNSHFGIERCGGPVPAAPGKARPSP